MMKWFGCRILILLICLSQSESENIKIDSEDLEKCRSSTKLSKSEAETMINPKNKPHSKDEMCFLKCYYEKHPVSAAGNYEVQTNDEDPYNVSLSDETVKSKNNVVQTCIKHATFKNASDPCELGLITRLCHQQYSRLLSLLIAQLLDQLDED